MTQGRLMGRIRGMGQAGKTAQSPGAAPGGATGDNSANQPRQRAGTRYASGTSSPGGTPDAFPYSAGTQATGLQPVQAGTTAAQGAVAASGRGGLVTASPPGPMVMPVQAVTVGPTSGEYVTLGQQDLVPIFTSDGAIIPATAPGRWAQLRAAGRP